MSKETGYSYSHMTRLFSSVSGGLQAVTSIGAGFISHLKNSCIPNSRAFKAAFGSSPAHYRKTGLNLVVQAKRELDDREDFEVYQRRVLSIDAPDNEVKIFIPIR